MRFKYQTILRDENGIVLPSATVSFYLAGTTTAANVYASATSTVALNSTTTGSDGSFTVYFDAFEYGSEQTYKLVYSLDNYQSYTLDNLKPVDVVLQAYTIATDTSVSNTLNIPRGVSFAIASGKTLTISGAFSAELYQVFSGDGSVSFTSNEQPIYPEWFGAIADGASDDTTEIRKALNSGRRVILRDGATYGVTAVDSDCALIVNSNQYLYGGGTLKPLSAITGSMIRNANWGSWTVRDSDITIEDINVDCNSVNVTQGIYLWGVDRPKVLDCKVHDNGTGGNLIWLFYCADLEIARCETYNSGDANGISIRSGKVLKFSAVAATDICTTTANHGYSDGDMVMLETSRAVGSALPAGLSRDTEYFIANKGDATFQLAATRKDALAGTPVIDITDTGTNQAYISDLMGGGKVISNYSHGNTDVGINAMGIKGIIYENNRCERNANGMLIERDTGTFSLVDPPSMPCRDVVIKNCTCAYNTSRGWHAYRGHKNILIDGGFYCYNSLDGIGLSGTTNDVLDAVTIRGAIIFNNGQRGIRFNVDGGTIKHTQIENCQIYNNGQAWSGATYYAGIFANSANTDYLSLIGNLIYDSQGGSATQKHAVHLGGPTNCKVLHNTTYGHVTSEYNLTSAGTGLLFKSNIASQILTYGATVDVDVAKGENMILTVTDGVAFQINNPTNVFPGATMSICVLNSSGGAMGAVTLDTAYLVSWAAPADTKCVYLNFVYQNSQWYGVASGDL